MQHQDIEPKTRKLHIPVPLEFIQFKARDIGSIAMPHYVASHPEFTIESDLHEKINCELRSPSYIAYNSDIGIAEVQGRRETQEDRMITGKLDGKLTKDLIAEDWEIAIKNTAKAMHEQVKAKKLKSGSCMAGVVAVGSTLHHFNLGDSTIHLVRFEGPLAYCRRLNDLQKGSFIDSDGNHLNVGGAIGDISYDDLQHEPVCGSETVKGDIAFAVVACDGLTEMYRLAKKEGDYQSKETIAKIIAAHKQEGPAAIARALVLNALNRSRDNISAIVIPLDPASINPIYGIVFDGHYDESVAEYLYQNFADEFDKQLVLRVELRVKASKTVKEIPSESKLKTSAEIFKTLQIEPAAPQLSVQPSVSDRQHLISIFTDAVFIVNQLKQRTQACKATGLKKMETITIQYTYPEVMLQHFKQIATKKLAKSVLGRDDRVKGFYKALKKLDISQPTDEDVKKFDHLADEFRPYIDRKYKVTPVIQEEEKKDRRPR